MIRNKRETGFEILRVLAMFLIGAVHVMNYGGMLANAPQSTILWQRLIYSVFVVSVNVFVLISAYFMVCSRLKITKLIKLWCLVFAYSVISYLVASIFLFDNFTFGGLISSCFPILTNKYWFFTAYFILMLLSPFLNKVLHNSSKKELYILILLLFGLTCVATRMEIGSVFNLNGGYTVFWFCILYLIAGTLRLYPINLGKKKCIVLYVLLTIILWLNSGIATSNSVALFFINSLDYTSPLVLICSILLILIFKDINIQNTLIHNSICFVSSLTFGIYLTQESSIKPYLYFNILKVQSFYNSSYAPLGVLLFALGIFIFGLIIELVRKFLLILFNKLTHRKKTTSDNISISENNQ